MKTVAPTPQRSGRAFSKRLFAILLRAFPREFRDRFGEEMTELFRDQLRASAVNGARATLLLWIHTIPAMLVAAFRERLDDAGISFSPSPQRRSDRVLETFTADLRFASRMLRKNPVFAIVAVLCISIGSGAVTSIFSVLNALILRPLPGASHAGELLRLERKQPGGMDGVSASYLLYEKLKDRSHTLDGVAAWGKTSLTLRAGDDAGVPVYGNFVTGNLFDVLGVRPIAGRFFLPEEDEIEMARPVIVVSERFWRARLDADPSVIGRPIGVNGHAYTLVGVAPAAFAGLDAPIATDAWLPMMMQAQIRQSAGPLSSANVTWLRLCARLKRGATIDAAHRELAALTAEYVSEAGESPVIRQYSDMHLSALTGLPPDASGPLSTFLILLLGAAALVLLIASVNVASMLSARAITRRREIAVRAALGATRSRLVRQLLTEILMLFALGAAGGVALAAMQTTLLERVSLPLSVLSVPIALDLSPDWRVLAFALGVSLATGVLFGLPPALKAANGDTASRMRDGSAGSGTRRSVWANGLVVGQLALSLVLLVGAGLFVRALDRGTHIDPGFDAAGVATATFNTESWGYDTAKGREFYRQLRERIASTLGVTDVSFAAFLPLTMQSNGGTVQLTGDIGNANADGVGMRRLTVDADYFEALRIPIVAGRAITRTDEERAPKIVVVNETFAHQHWPGQSAIGHTIGFQGDKLTIVGIARDAKYSTLNEPLMAFMYLPMSQYWEAKQSLIVRAPGLDLRTVAKAIEHATRAIDPALPRPTVITLHAENAAVLLPQRLAAIITGVLGAIGLSLATIGLYGIIAYSTARRSQEIGIRVALGARPSDVLRMIVGDGLRLTAGGVAIGLVLAAGATRLLVRFLFGISPLDAGTFVFMSVLFAAIAAVASYLPARRAAGANPMSVLRGD